MSNESFAFSYIDGTELLPRYRVKVKPLKSTGVPISTLLLKHDASKCSEHKENYSIGRPLCESWTRSSVICFRFASFRKVCIEMSGVLEWFLQLTLFGRLQHSTVNFLFLFSDLSSPSISLVLQSKVKSRMTPSQSVPSCDVIELADRAIRVRHKLGSKTCLFLA